MANGWKPVPNGRISPSSYTYLLTTDDIQVVSSIPGRTRLKVSPQHRNSRKLQQIARVLKANEKVYDVRVNGDCGSIVVLYHHGSVSDSEILSGLLSDRTVARKVNAGSIESSGELTNTFANLNKPVKQATDGRVELLLLIVIGLGALGILQLVFNGLQLKAAP